ncbi:Flp pilus assembly protein CpaB [Thalassovita gelatinovora]|uniref:Flp pilus assembly protein CpaB n=1 Tax=Thalassovita gelatinovora TaxID=53501 RepID=UPI000944DB99|nr:Flp pilus assembly protein CpaB [Thalassovita gelatinovora]QIZ79191.1 Flp pilus assembly protein CpaB [Thalassovita gelatinovora]
MLRSLIIAIALVCGGSAAVLVKTVAPAGISSASIDPDHAPVPIVQVLVAATELTEGTETKPELLAWATWPKDAASESYHIRTGADDELEQFTGMILRHNFAPGQPILSGSLSNSREGYLSALLSAGMRAVAIEVSAAQTAGGFILPNNRVDVLLTTNCTSGIACKHAMKTETILQNVRVLAIDQSGSSPNSESAVIIGKTATLEMAPEDAETIIAAEASGSISLLLRSVDDNEIKELAQSEPIFALPEATAEVEPIRTVKVNRGGVSEVVVLN